MENTIEKLKDEARRSWSGKTGEERAERLEEYLKAKLEEYSNALDIPQEDLLNAWEENRNYSAINYYQEANQPAINSENTRVFETVEELLNSIGEKKFRCPACEGTSTNPYSCDSGERLAKGKICDWKVYGLFGDLGKGVFVYVKNQLKGEQMFIPVSWEEKNSVMADA